MKTDNPEEVEIFKISVTPFSSRCHRFAAEEKKKTYLVRESQDKLIKKEHLEVIRESHIIGGYFTYTLDEKKVKGLIDQLQKKALKFQDEIINKARTQADLILNAEFEFKDKFNWRK